MFRSAAGTVRAGRTTTIRIRTSRFPPCLHNGSLVTELTAITQYLTELVSGLRDGTAAGPSGAGCLSVLACLLCRRDRTRGNRLHQRPDADQSGRLRRAIRICARTWSPTLDRQPYLLGEQISGADLMLGGALAWMRKLLPESISVDRYVKTLTSRPALARAREIDSKPDGFHD